MASDQTLYEELGELRQLARSTAEILKDVQADLKMRSRANWPVLTGFATVLLACLGALWALAIEPIKADIADTMAKDVIILKFDHVMHEQTRLASAVERLGQAVKEIDRKVTPNNGEGK